MNLGSTTLIGQKYYKQQQPVPLPSKKNPCKSSVFSTWRVQTTSALFYALLHACVVAQSCPALSNPMDCSPPSSSVHGILQTRILEWVAIPSSRGSSRPRDWTHVSCVSCTAGGFFTCWAIREAALCLLVHIYCGLIIVVVVDCHWAGTILEDAAPRVGTEISCHPSSMTKSNQHHGPPFSFQDKVRALEERPRQRRTWGTGREERRDLRRSDFQVLSHSPLT